MCSISRCLSPIVLVSEYGMEYRQPMATARSSKTSKKTGRSAWQDALAGAFRRWGYLAAGLDALGRLQPYEHPDIADAVKGAAKTEIERWRRIYCGPVGVEFMHLVDRERAMWVAEWMENEDSVHDQASILARLARAELFERFLHARYVGSKRYSLEGVAGIIPLIDSILETFAELHGEFVVIAMSHRGRLNVMANVVGIPGEELFAGLEDMDAKSVLGSGDVKYHLGATGAYKTQSGKTIRVHLVSNPSHLEAVDPVVMGRVRAKQDRMGEEGVHKILSLTLHGDAAFAGQGITAETLNLADLNGYSIGGTIHVVVNNLIGFTAEYPLLHSSRFSSDLGKRQSIPIIHVNGEDPEAVTRAGRMAMEYKKQFGGDVVIDVIGYRRYGHSEVEDPSTTQPLLYEKIKDRPMLWELYAKHLNKSPDSLEQMREKNLGPDGRRAGGGTKTERPSSDAYVAILLGSLCWRSLWSRPRSGHGCFARASPRDRGTNDHGAGWFSSSSQDSAPLRSTPENGKRRSTGGLGDGGGPRVRVLTLGRDAGASRRGGQSTWHIQPAPRRRARYRNGEGVCPDGPFAAGPGSFRRHRFTAFGGCRAGF